MGGRWIGAATMCALASPALAATAPFAAKIDAAKQAMLIDPAAALRLAREAAALAPRVVAPDTPALADATARWLEGESLTRMGRAAEARPVLAAGLREVVSAHPNTKLHGDLMRAHGNANAVTGDVQQALRDFQQAHDIYRRAGEPRGQAMALQNIGGIYTDAGDYPRVLRYYEQSAEVYDGDPALLLSAHNNLGRALRDLRRLPEAEAEFKRGLAIARTIGSPVLEASILENLAAAQVDAGRLDAADASLARARRITADDPEASRFIWGVAAQSAAKRGDMPRAATLLERTFAGGAVDSEPAFREFHRTAYEVYKALGRDGEALAHLEAFKRLDDQARTLAAGTNTALMAARFDFANQDLKISSLRAGQAQRDAELAASQSRFQSTLFGGALSVAAFILALVLIALFQIRRSRNQTRAANASLSTANGALQKALQAKTEFLATTSHEIRTPLNGILGMTQVILADRAVAGPTRDKIKLLHGAGETMRALVDDILDIAKMETGNLTLDPGPMRLHSMLRDAADLWRGQAEAKGLALLLDLDAAPDGIVADEGRLRQVVFNLMSNAVKFTEAGRVTLAARAVEDDNGAQLEIIVDDTGIGVPDHALDDIFDSFRQVDGGTTRRFGGTGLGLAICRNIATAMDGTITVRSRVAEGSVFALSVPLLRDIGDDMGKAGADDVRLLLLVEANPLTRSVLAAVLGKAFDRIDFAGDVDEALAALAVGRPAVVLVDRLTVSAVATKAPALLRAIVDAARYAPVVMLCPPGGEAEQAALVRAGAAQVLVKPVAAQAVLGRIATLAAPPDRAAA